MGDAPPVIPFETRFPCPVCVGVQMDKVALRAQRRTLILDHCTRCGGVWFEKGEPLHLTTLHSPTELWKLIPPRQHILRPPCHGCGTPLDRAARECAACGRANELHCPVCDTKTARMSHQGATLDVCSQCKGVWFDHAELRELWSLQLAELAKRSPNMRAHEGGSPLLEAFFWAPDLVFWSGYSAASGIDSAAGAVAGGAVEAGPGVIDAISSASESVFEAIAGIIAGLFEG